MYNRPEQILEQYDLTVNAISKGRESYLCDTSQGAKILREYRLKRAGRIFGTDDEVFKGAGIECACGHGDERGKSYCCGRR